VTGARLLTAAGLVALGVSAPGCGPRPPEMTAYVSIKELMQNEIDPIADNIFDAVGTDISAKGIIDTKPTSDEDWAKVRIGAITLLEATNLLKIPRAAAPPGDTNKSDGPNAPELSPAQIEANINRDRAVWNRHVDELRDIALEALATVKARNADTLFEVGGKLDKACENCHLEYWYPGDKKDVLEDEQKRATLPTERRQK
jgi:hypothetical protein